MSISLLIGDMMHYLQELPDNKGDEDAPKSKDESI